VFVYRRGRGGHGDEIMATTNDTAKWYGRNTKERTIFNPDFRVKRGVVKVEHAEWAQQYAGRLLVEPHIKGTFSGENKRYPWARWEELVDRAPFKLAQCAPAGKQFLSGVEKIETPGFSAAVSVLAVSKGIVTTEGGLHHAAGALKKPAVIIFGAFNQAKLFGYEGHINIEEPDEQCLGMRRTHPACLAAMERISVDRVLAAMVQLWG
jgi:ADP-heptose:LPS heptosyltransferase